MLNLKNLSIRLKPTILGVLSFVTGIVVATLLFIQYSDNKQLTVTTLENSFKQLSLKITEKVKNYDKDSESFIKTLKHFKEIYNMPQIGKSSKLDEIFASNINIRDYIYSIYIGHKDGTFYEMINLDIDQKIKLKYNSPDNARWLIIKIINTKKSKIRYEEFLDQDFNLIKSASKPAIYDPSSRPWYKQALNSKDIIKTTPYMFSNFETMGLTYAKEIKNSGIVIGLDITLKSLNDLLSRQKLVNESEIFIYDDKGDITTYTKIGSPHSQIKSHLDNYHKGLGDLNKNIVMIDNREFYHFNSLLQINDNRKQYIKIISPIDSLMKPYIKQIYLNITISVIVFFIIAIPLIIYSSNMISKPILMISKENEKIKNRKFKEVRKIRSFILEIDELSTSLVVMSDSIDNYQQEQKNLMDSFIKLIATAIDEKSKYTGNHCKRVPELSLMIIDEANRSKEGIFKDFSIKDEEELRELSISAWLHDCGKVTTPEYVIDKGTKLETIYNRIHEIRTRFEVIYRDLTIEYYKKIYENNENKAEVEKWLETEQKKLFNDFEFIANSNIGGEFLDDENKEKIINISKRTWLRYFDDTLGLSHDEQQRVEKDLSLPVKENLLSDKKSHLIKRDSCDILERVKYGFKRDIPPYKYNFGEIYNLTIEKGTLNYEERYKIEDHIVMTIKMLEELPFPENLKNVPLYAGAHHETLIGTGYPKQLMKKDMPLPSRIIALADIFEALTAADRPYKEAKKLSQVIKIMGFMVKDQHIDEDLFRLFLKSGIYKTYAQKHLKPEQLDDVDITRYL